MIVCFSGWKRSGKDSAADLIVSRFGFKRLSFASPLKDLVAELYGVTRGSLDDQNLKEVPLYDLPVDPQDEFSHKIAEHMKLEFKQDANGASFWTRRALLILEGSVKRSVSPSYWVSKALQKIEPGMLTVITDMRYKSEARLIKEYADSIGERVLMIRINRFDTSPSNDGSERDMDDYLSWDHTVENKTSLEDFEQRIEKLIYGYL